MQMPSDQCSSDQAAALAIPLDFESLPLRVREIAMLRGLGYSYRAIGERYSVSPQAVSLMLSRHLRARQILTGGELGRLSARAVNVLGRLGVRSREDASAADIMSKLPYERNCGRKTSDEISRWLAGTPLAPPVD